MSTSERLRQARAHFCDQTDQEITSESIVIRDEHYVGRRLESTDHRALWFIESGELKIYTRDAGHLITLDAAALSQPVVREDAGDRPSTISIESRRHRSDEVVRRAA